MAIVSRLDLSRVSCESSDLLDVELVDFRQVRVHSQRLRIGNPVSPVFILRLDGRRHSAGSEACVRSTETSFDERSFGRWHTLQEFWFGKGNFELNKVRNFSSESQNHFPIRPNEREGMSVIAFSTPAMCIGINGEAPAAFSRVAMTRSRAAAVFDFLEVSFLVQVTVGSLSLSKARCLFLRHGTLNSMSKRRKSIPAHSRSEFVIFPFGFLAWHKINFLTSGGHSNRHTVGSMESHSPTRTAATPSVDASIIPM